MNPSRDKPKELESGRYISENLDDLNHFYRYIIELDIVVNEKSYILTLRGLKTKYGATQIEDMFRKSKRYVFRRNKPNEHAMCVWDNTSFTLYPYRLGVPYVFNKSKGMNENEQIN